MKPLKRRLEELKSYCEGNKSLEQLFKDAIDELQQEIDWIDNEIEKVKNVKLNENDFLIIGLQLGLEIVRERLSD